MNKEEYKKKSSATDQSKTELNKIFFKFIIGRIWRKSK